MRLSVLTAAALAAGLTVATAAFAQQPPPPAPPSASPEAAGPKGEYPDRPSRPLFTEADREAFFDAKLAALHVGLKLTPEQEKLWPAVETQLRAGAKARAERMAKARGGPPPANAIGWLRKLSEEDFEQGATLKALADAAEPLYNSLSEDQKRRLPPLLHGIRPHGAGPFAGHMMGMGPGCRMMGMGPGGMGMGPRGHREGPPPGPGGHGDDDDDEGGE